MPVCHGTDEDSARDIVARGLDQQAWEMAAGGAGPDPKGFSVTANLQHAQDWARWRALRWAPVYFGPFLSAVRGAIPWDF